MTETNAHRIQSRLDRQLLIGHQERNSDLDQPVSGGELCRSQCCSVERQDQVWIRTQDTESELKVKEGQNTGKFLPGLGSISE